MGDSGDVMVAAVELREDFCAGQLRRLAAKARDPGQARRLLALAAVREGKSRAEAASIGGMDRQTLRDWVHRFNAGGVDGLISHTAPGAAAKLSASQKEDLQAIVEAGPDPLVDGVVRWRCRDLKRVIKQRFDVDLAEVSIGRILWELGFSHVSPRPQNPKQDPQAIEAFKKTSTAG